MVSSEPSHTWLHELCTFTLSQCFMVIPGYKSGVSGSGKMSNAEILETEADGHIGILYYFDCEVVLPLLGQIYVASPVSHHIQSYLRH
jgi:hypothetical protein